MKAAAKMLRLPTRKREQTIPDSKRKMNRRPRVGESVGTASSIGFEPVQKGQKLQQHDNATMPTAEITHLGYC